ncbi:unnamed protein product, partial [Rotaria magnacalcarata]
MQQKICRYCSNNLTTENSLKKRLNEFPLYLREISPNSEPFFNFCNEQCYNAYLTNLQLQQQQQQQQTVSVNIKNEPVDRLP